MSVTMIDTLKTAEQLQASGFTETQAKGVIQVLLREREANVQNLATKQDITLLKQDIALLKQDIDKDMALMRRDIEACATKQDLNDAINGIKTTIIEMMKWVMGTMVAMTGIFAAIVKIF